MNKDNYLITVSCNNGFEMITSDYDDRETLHLLINNLKALLSKNTTNRPFFGKVTHGKLQLENTSQGGAFLRVIQLSAYYRQYICKYKNIHPAIKAINMVTDKYQLHQTSYLSDYPLYSSDNVIQLNNAISEFRGIISSQEYKKSVSEFIKGSVRNKKRAENYREYLFNNYSRLLIVRVDLSYRKEISRKVTPDILNKHRSDLYQAMQSEPLFQHCVGYIFKLEYGHVKGFHYHCLFFFNGRNVRRDIILAKCIGEFWQHKITEEAGIYYNCNYFKERYEISGIGMVHRNDSNKQEGLKRAINYICKSDQWVKLQVPRMKRTFWRGTIKNSKKKKQDK